ncbi:MAG: FKBP-type peptidyl-prolyl cis-trans isomerase, partial [Pirellulaceae bacterium]
MHVRLSRSVVVLGLFLLLTKVAMSADESKEVAFPDLPKGAGKVDADASKKFTATPSGLKYRVLRKGTGGKPMSVDSVKVNYHGWLNDGKVFDSSY